MPRAKVEKVVATENGWETVEIEVGERGATKTARYQRPTADVFPTFLTDVLSHATDKEYGKALYMRVFDVKAEDAPKEGESPLEFLRRMFVTSIDRKARADVYESIAQESTKIKVGKEDVDILTFTLKQILKGINGMLAQVSLRASAGGDTEEAIKAAERSVGFGPWKTAARKLVEAKAIAYNEDAGVYTPVDGVDVSAKAEDLVAA